MPYETIRCQVCNSEYEAYVSTRHERDEEGNVVRRQTLTLDEGWTATLSTYAACCDPSYTCPACQPEKLAHGLDSLWNAKAIVDAIQERLVANGFPETARAIADCKIQVIKAVREVFSQARLEVRPERRPANGPVSRIVRWTFPPDEE